MSRKPTARPRSPKPEGSKLKGSKPKGSEKGSKNSSKSTADRPRRPRLARSAKSGASARKPGKAARERLHPPAEEDLGGGDICSLEEKPSTEDNMPLVAHAPDFAGAPEDHHWKRSLGTAVIALTVALFGVLSLLIVDHGLWERPYRESARAHAATEAAVAADGGFVTPTRRPSLYSRTVQ
jgi:hypothetical protein